MMEKVQALGKERRSGRSRLMVSDLFTNQPAARNRQTHSHPDRIQDKWSQNVCSVLIKKRLHFLSLLMKILAIVD